MRAAVSARALFVYQRLAIHSFGEAIPSCRGQFYDGDIWEVTHFIQLFAEAARFRSFAVYK